MDENLLQKLAAEIVDRFQTTKLALTDGVTDAAQRHELNPEQIHRLVETVNNMAFLKRFEGASDRMAASEFEPADANAALQRLLSDAKDVMDAMAPIGGTSGGDNLAQDLATELPVTHPGAPPPLPPATPEPMMEPKVSSAITVMRLRKTAAELCDRTYQARTAFTDEFQKLATVFTRLGAPSFEQFESDALYKWGAAAAPHLGALRAALRRPPAMYDAGINQKVAKIIDSRTPEMQSFARLLGFYADIKQAQAAEVKIQAYLKQAEAHVQSTTAR
jgi:hypothetical protein